jgi:anti-sigma regulatory factor (Ser/Thr protein kinase)
MDLKPPPSEVMSVSVAIRDSSGAAEARRVAGDLAKMLRFSEADAGRAALVVTEAATNIVEHAGGGEILLRSMAMDAGAGIEILALDAGPGIANVAECMVDGYSTKDSRGAGLGAIERQSTAFDIFSAVGKGTAVLSRVEVTPDGRPRAAYGRLCWGAVCIPLRDERVCGDAWVIHDTGERSTLMVVDGVGHGLHAFDAAQTALEVFAKEVLQSPVSILRALDQALRTTRGAVALVADVDWATRRMRSIGFGNIAAKLLQPDRRAAGIISHPGTLGQGTFPGGKRGPEIERAREFTHHWPENGLLIIHSDGLSSRWDLDDYPGIRGKDPSLIAGVLYRDFRNQKDDVVVLVCRERNAPRV